MYSCTLRFRNFHYYRGWKRLAKTWRTQQLNRLLNFYFHTTKTCTHFSVQYCRYLKDHCCAMKVSPACPSDNNSIKAEMSTRRWWNDTEETEVLREEPCPSATWYITNPTWTDLRWNPSADRLSHDSAKGHSATHMTFKIAVRTSQKTRRFHITKTSQLMLYREIIAVCSEIHTKHINTLCEKVYSFQMVSKMAGTNTEHCVLNGCSTIATVKRWVHVAWHSTSLVTVSSLNLRNLFIHFKRSEPQREMMLPARTAVQRHWRCRHGCTLWRLYTLTVQTRLYPVTSPHTLLLKIVLILSYASFLFIPRVFLQRGLYKYKL